MNNQSQESFFQQRIKDFKNEHAQLVKRSQLFSVLRISVFFLFLACSIYFINIKLGTWLVASIFFFIISFGMLLRRHNRIRFAISLSEELVTLNQEEILRIDGSLKEIEFEKTDTALHEDHPYANDLDIFGSHSLYRLISRSGLVGTKELQKKWLLTPAPKSMILARQESLKELSGKTEWRQEITGLGRIGKKKGSKKSDLFQELTTWTSRTMQTFDQPLWRAAQYIIPALSLIFVVSVTYLEAPQWLFAIPPLVNLVLLKQLFAPLMDITKKVDGMSNYLERYEKIIGKIKAEDFSSEHLSNLKNSLTLPQQSAEKAIRSLKNILYFLENRANLLYGVVNAYFLTDLIIAQATIRWDKKNGLHLDAWIKAIHEIDCLNDMASCHMVNPNFQFPDISDEEFVLSGEKIGHPLLKPGNRVHNDFKMKSEGSLGLITGSNMSGKSTFLRTVGVNLVLAQMGAPVCAEKFQFSLTGIFTSMRTQDNLEESVSSFYAELKRIKTLLNSLESEVPVFYFLDEILKGTNSDDRHIGAMALIDQLTKKPCMGMISTHDVHLAELSKENSKIENYSFNSTIDGDKIDFDYKLTPGPCKSFNASKLMEQMGIIKSAESKVDQ